MYRSHASSIYTNREHRRDGESEHSIFSSAARSFHHCEHVLYPSSTVHIHTNPYILKQMFRSITRRKIDEWELLLRSSLISLCIFRLPFVRTFVVAAAVAVCFLAHFSFALSLALLRPSSQKSTFLSRSPSLSLSFFLTYSHFILLQTVCICISTMSRDFPFLFRNIDIFNDCSNIFCLSILSPFFTLLICICVCVRSFRSISNFLKKTNFVPKKTFLYFFLVCFHHYHHENEDVVFIHD